MHYNVQKAIQTTLLYSDLFDFALTAPEVWRFLISKKPVSATLFHKAITTPSALFVQKNGYFCLPGREKLIMKRKNALTEVKKKMKCAGEAARLLSYIPSILFIGISGGLAVGSASKVDDIDLFIITKKGSLFRTRLEVLALLETMGQRRSRTDTTAPDKICVNLLIDASRLHWPLAKQNIYTAHEIAQLYPLFDKEDMYKKFLFANTWITNFLPNSLDHPSHLAGSEWERNYYTLQVVDAALSCPPFSLVIKQLQMRSISKHKTKEFVSNHLLAFHPNDYGSKILADFKKKSRNSGLLTKK